MKRTALTLCVIMAMGTLANAACYKCVNSKGDVSFTDNPSQDVKCEWLAKCSSTYNEEMERENEKKDAISRSQWEEAEARKSELKQQEMDAKKLELKQKELELRQRELDATADQAQKENITDVYVPVIRHRKIIKENHDGRYPLPPESEMKHKELDPKARKDMKQKNKVKGQAGSPPATKITNENSTDKVQQITPTQPYPIVKQIK
jgi:hypothetical protein